MPSHLEGGEGIINVHIDPSEGRGQEASSQEEIHESTLQGVNPRESSLPDVSEIKVFACCVAS